MLFVYLNPYKSVQKFEKHKDGILKLLNAISCLKTNILTKLPKYLKVITSSYIYIWNKNGNFSHAIRKVSDTLYELSGPNYLCMCVCVTKYCYYVCKKFSIPVKECQSKFSPFHHVILSTRFFVMSNPFSNALIHPQNWHEIVCEIRMGLYI